MCQTRNRARTACSRGAVRLSAQACRRYCFFRMGVISLEQLSKTQFHGNSDLNQMEGHHNEQR